MLERERKIHKKISKNQTLKAKRYLKNGNLAEAIDHYRMALKYGPANLEARIGLSECYLKKGEYDEAKKRLTYVFENQKALEPTKSDVKRIYNNLLIIEQKVGVFKDQYKYCEILEKIDKKDKNIENKKIEIILGDNNPSLSKKTYEKILKKNKDNKAALINLGDLHLKWKDFSKATHFYNKVLDKKIGKSILEIEGRALIGLAWIKFLIYKDTGNETFLREANELSEKAINCERRAIMDNKRIYYEAAKIKSHFINNDSLKFHVVYKYLETAIDLDLDYLDARSLRAKIILDHYNSPYQSPFYYRTAARDLMKIASMKPSEENVRKAFEVVSKVDWKSAERLKKQLDRIIFFKNRKKVFVAEVLDDIEEKERIFFWNEIKKELQKIQEEDFKKMKTTIMRTRSLVEGRIKKGLKGRNELSEEELKYLYLNQVLHLSLGNIETAVDLETSFFNYPDQEHFIVSDAFSYIGKIEDIIQDENSKNAKKAYDNHRDFNSSNQITYKNFKPLELKKSEVTKMISFLEGKGGTKYLSKKTPELNIIKPKRTMKVKLEKYERNPQAIERTNITRD